MVNNFAIFKNVESVKDASLFSCPITGLHSLKMCVIYFTHHCYDQI